MCSVDSGNNNFPGGSVLSRAAAAPRPRHLRLLATKHHFRDSPKYWPGFPSYFFLILSMLRTVARVIIRCRCKKDHNRQRNREKGISFTTWSLLIHRTHSGGGSACGYSRWISAFLCRGGHFLRLLHRLRFLQCVFLLIFKFFLGNPHFCTTRPRVSLSLPSSPASPAFTYQPERRIHFVPEEICAWRTFEISVPGMKFLSAQSSSE